MAAAPTAADEPLDLGFRLEPLVDDYLIDTLTDARLTLHRPTPREVAIVHDAPWEGNTCAYHTVFQDGELYRMYYRGSDAGEGERKPHPELVCYAESRDGVHWTRPELGLSEFDGSTKNNIVWTGVGSHDFAPFRDANPDCAPEAKYKALGRGPGGLYAFKSPDGLRWTLLAEKPVITKGAFDSQNLAFWDTVRGRYVDFHRGFKDGVRDVMTSTSADFLRWTEPVWLEYPGAAREHLYTNQIAPYYRAPHVFFGFPKRFVPSRNATGFAHGGVSDGVFMTSRDGLKFHRWGEALIRPGLQPDRWVCRNNMTAWGIVVTQSGIPGAPDELSIYSSESYYQGDAVRLRRFTVRIDGFVSVQAPSTGGELLTKLLRFGPRSSPDTPLETTTDPGPATAGGVELVLNFATSAAGSIRCEILDQTGKPLDGFALADCDEIFGDQLERAVSWGGETNLGPLAEMPIRLRFVLHDADLFSLQFRPKPAE
jgi:hypothetical protein